MDAKALQKMRGSKEITTAVVVDAGQGNFPRKITLQLKGVETEAINNGTLLRKTNKVQVLLKDGCLPEVISKADDRRFPVFSEWFHREFEK